MEEYRIKLPHEDSYVTGHIPALKIKTEDIIHNLTYIAEESAALCETLKHLAKQLKEIRKELDKL